MTTLETVLLAILIYIVVVILNVCFDKAACIMYKQPFFLSESIVMGLVPILNIVFLVLAIYLCLAAVVNITPGE